MTSKDLEKIQEELKWIQIQEQHDMSFSKRLSSKGVMGFLVPAGCLVTTGVLASGVYQMFKKNKKQQQLLMRCRVAAQGATVLLAVISVLAVPFQGSKTETE